MEYILGIYRLLTELIKIEREAQLDREHSEQGQKENQSSNKQKQLDEKIFKIVSRYHDYVRRGEVDRYLKALGYSFMGRITYSSIRVEDEEQEENEDDIFFEHEENEHEILFEDEENGDDILLDRTDGETQEWEVPYIPVSKDWQMLCCSNLG